MAGSGRGSGVGPFVWRLVPGGAVPAQNQDSARSGGVSDGPGVAGGGRGDAVENSARAGGPGPCCAVPAQDDRLRLGAASAFVDADCPGAARRGYGYAIEGAGAVALRARYSRPPRAVPVLDERPWPVIAAGGPDCPCAVRGHYGDAKENAAARRVRAWHARPGRAVP